MIVPSRQGLSRSKTRRNSRAKNPGCAQSVVGDEARGAVFQILICSCKESEERDTALAEQWMHGTLSIP